MKARHGSGLPRLTHEETLRLHSEILTHMSEGANLTRIKDAVIVYTNPRFNEMFGYAPGELLGRHVSVLNDPEDQSPAERSRQIAAELRRRGRWEGETLVVETANFTDKNPFRGASDKMKVIERFTRTAPDVIKYEFTIDDETTWPTPWSAEIPMKQTKGPIFEFSCHETNYGVVNTLAGARAEEKRLAEEAAKKGK